MKAFRKLKIYSAFTKANFLLAFAYRGSVFLWLLGGLLTAVMSGLLWWAVFSFGGSDAIGGFSYPQMLLYTVLSAVCAEVIYCGTADEIARDVRNGMIGMRLSKPISYQGMQAASAVGNFSGKLVIVGIPMMTIGTLVAVFGFGLDGIQWYNVLLFIPTLFLGMMLNNALGFMFGQIAFKTQAMWGVLSMTDLFISFLSGAVVPLSLFPSWAQNILAYTPFPSVMSLPVRLFLGMNSWEQTLIGLCSSVFWIVVLNVLGALWYKRSVRHVVVFGG